MTGAIKGLSTLHEKCPYSKYLSVFSPNAGKHGHFLPSGSEKLFQASDMERLHSRRWLRKLRGFYEIRKSKSPPYLFNLIPSSSKMHTARSSDNITPFKVRH